MATIKEIEVKIKELSRDKGRDVTNVFVDLLDYIIGFFGTRTWMQRMQRNEPESSVNEQPKQLRIDF